MQLRREGVITPGRAQVREKIRNHLSSTLIIAKKKKLRNEVPRVHVLQILWSGMIV